MVKRLWFKSVVALVVLPVFFLTGCFTLQPTHFDVQPAPGKPLQMFTQDGKECEAWAFQQVGGQEAINSTAESAATSAAVGAAVGTLFGLALGSLVGHAGSGAGFGAAIGGLGGVEAGAQTAHLSRAELQARYDNYYEQCMFVKGNTVHGTAPMLIMPPPPPPAGPTPPPQQ